MLQGTRARPRATEISSLPLIAASDQGGTLDYDATGERCWAKASFDNNWIEVCMRRFIESCIHSRYSKICEQRLGGNYPPKQIRAKGRTVSVFKDTRSVLGHLYET